MEDGELPLCEDEKKIKIGSVGGLCGLVMRTYSLKAMFILIGLDMTTSSRMDLKSTEN
jgi:hypothetical protein